MKYLLSNRQKKELEERGSLLSIAIPVPDDFPEDGDPLVYVRSVLDVPSAWVRCVEELELPVIAPLAPGVSGLTGVLGAIWHKTTPEKGLVYRIPCFVVQLAVGKTRNASKTQWPAFVVIDGKVYP